MAGPRLSARALLPVLALSALLSACGPSPESAAGFRLPDGDSDMGRQAFASLGCTACHQVLGDDELAYVGGGEPVVLGGEISRVKTYGELVTSVINPSHRISPRFAARDEMPEDGGSPMAATMLNEVMTIQQLIDLVAFLQGTYEVVPPTNNTYLYYYP